MKEKYGLDWEDYLNSVVFDEIDKLNKAGDTTKTGFFTYQAIQNIPLIKYKGLSDKENKKAKQIAEEVLIRSKRDNNYNEVSIVYDYKDPDNYAIVYGDEDSVKFMSDEKTRDLIHSANPLMIMSFRNYPDDTNISFDDLAIFCIMNQIRVMSIINSKGELSYINRHRNIDLTTIFASCVNEVIKEKEERILQNLTKEEKKLISNNLLEKLDDVGVVYHNWDSKEIKRKFEDKTVSFPTLTVLCGVPGVGKTEYAKELKQYNPYIEIVSLSSELKNITLNTGERNVPLALKNIFEQIKESLIQGKDVVYDASNLMQEHRKDLLMALEDIDAIKEIHFFNPSKETALVNCFIKDISITKQRLYNLIDIIAENKPTTIEGWDKVINVPILERELTPEYEQLINEQVNEENNIDDPFSDVITKEDGFEPADND